LSLHHRKEISYVAMVNGVEPVVDELDDPIRCDVLGHDEPTVVRHRGSTP